MKLSALSVILSSLVLFGVVAADCECGYSVNTTDSEHHAVFTDLLESDFTTLGSISDNTDWRPQAWAVDAKSSRGPYGRSTEVRNVISNPQGKKGTGIGKNGDDAGLELWVRAIDPDDEKVPVAEVASAREDIFHASIRAGIKATKVNGTCGAFFWYLNDTQEIDMEFLSKTFMKDSGRLDLVLHSQLSLQQGGDASATPTFQSPVLAFNPSEGFHEYRFDWVEGSVEFFVDGKRVGRFDSTAFIPTAPGKIILSHWSNGNPLWSAGPPAEDAKMVVSYVKAYFNSSDPARQKAHESRCKDKSAPNAVCLIPDQTVPPRVDVATHQEGLPYFFSKDPIGDKVKGQQVYGVSGGVRAGASMWALVTGLGVAAILL